MHQRDHRPFTTEERQSLERIVNPMLGARLVGEFFGIGCILIVMLPIMALAVYLAIYFWNLQVASWKPIVIGTLLIALCLRLFWMKTTKFEKLYRNCVKIDLEGGRAEVLHIRPFAAIQLKEIDDEGIGYFLDLGNNEIIFMQGQYLYPRVWGADFEKKRHDDESEMLLERKGIFPNNEIKITRAPKSRKLLNVEYLGSRFDPKARLHPDQIKSDIPEDGDLIPGSLDTLESDLKAWAERKAKEQAG